jgi:hypothetical protein
VPPPSSEERRGEGRPENTAGARGKHRSGRVSPDLAGSGRIWILKTLDSGPSNTDLEPLEADPLSGEEGR